MKKFILTFFSSMALCCLTACFALPVEEPVLPPPLISTTDASSYKTVSVARGDVLYYRDLNASYVPAREEALTFSVGDVYIKAIYVEIGDEVHQGDIVAELDREDFANALASAERDESWVRLGLKQLEERHALDLIEADITGIPLDEAAYLDERDGLLAQLELIRVKTAHLRFEDERRVVRAGMDGTVTYVLPFSEGDMSTVDQRVITVTDQTQSIFMARGAEIDYLVPGNHYDLNINADTYTVEIVNPEDMGISRVNSDEAYMVVIDEEQELFTSRTYASLRLILAETKDVLYVPYAAVKKANARIFVYVLADGVRTVRDVEIGLEGNNSIEIISGLEEGETVIID